MVWAFSNMAVFGKLKVVRVAVENWATHPAMNRYTSDSRKAHDLLVPSACRADGCPKK
jgi:hypothetical protein